MSYTPTVWKDGDVVTSARLNKIEEGIAGSTPMLSVTYAELLAMRNAGTLTPGMQYRITDYICTTTQEESRVVSHPFDVIVVADDASTLNENARACLHEGDTYYTATNHSANLEAWELKYCIDNDRNRFGWADATNGKGIIFWLKDERGNECPYDFKQIQFKRYKITECTVRRLVGKFTTLAHSNAITAIDETNPVWAYTFSLYDSGAETPIYEDGSVAVMDEVTGCLVHSNVIECYRNHANAEERTGAYIVYLNNIVFFNTFGNYCYSNTFGNNCGGNTFGDSCSGNTFGNNCGGNTFGGNCGGNTFGNSCSGNTFGDSCSGNTFGDNCYNNTFGNSCSGNTFVGSCGSNTFGDSCGGNTFGGSCGGNTFVGSCGGNIFGNNCGNNNFGNYCGNNNFGDNCGRNTFGNSCGSNTFGDNCKYVDISTGTQMAPKQYFNVLSGTIGTALSHITVPGTGGNNFITYVGRNSSGELKTWVPADMAT